MNMVVYLFYKYILSIVVILALINIAVLEFTTWRPFGYSSHCEGINRAILTVSYSIIASALFYLINVVLPSMHLRKARKRQVYYMLNNITGLIRSICNVQPFRLMGGIYQKDEFVTAFSELDLYEKDTFNRSCTQIDILKSTKTKLYEMSNLLLSEYGNELNYKEMDFVNRILDSPFIHQTIIPIDYSIPDEHSQQYNENSNQREIGTAIYDLYRLSLEMSCKSKHSFRTHLYKIVRKMCRSFFLNLH